MARKKAMHKRKKTTRTKHIRISKDIAPLVLAGAKLGARGIRAGGRAGYGFGKKHFTKENARKVKAKVSSLISKLQQVRAELKKKKAEKKYARVTMSIMR